MKRMNLKKAISLVTFMLVMTFGAQTSFAQLANTEEALVRVHAEIEVLNSLNLGDADPTNSADAIKNAVTVKYLDLVAGGLKEGMTTLNAVNQAQSFFTQTATSSRATLVSAVKQDVMNLLED